MFNFRRLTPLAVLLVACGQTNESTPSSDGGSMSTPPKDASGVLIPDATGIAVDSGSDAGDEADSGASDSGTGDLDAALSVDSGVPPPDPVPVRGQIVRAPGAPLPVENVRITVIDPPAADPTMPLQVMTDALGLFAFPSVVPTSGGRVRLFIDGSGGGGGPYVAMNNEYPVDPITEEVDVGVVNLMAMESTAVVDLGTENAMIVQRSDGRDEAMLLADVSVSGGGVPGEGVDARSAQLNLPAGTTLLFPQGAPLSVGIARVDLSAIPAPLPRAADGTPLFTSYFVTLQPSGVELSAPIGLELPSTDGLAVGTPITFFEVDTSTELFVERGQGEVQRIPGVGDFAVSNTPFISRFGWYAATPPCQARLTEVVGRVVDGASSPLVAVIVRTLGLRAESGQDGRFSIPNVPLGCGDRALQMIIEVLASHQRNDGTFLTGVSMPTSAVPEGMTDVGDIVLASPLFVVRSVPNHDSGVMLNSTFDVFFNQAVDSTTIDGVTVALQDLTLSSGVCVGSNTSVAGTPMIDPTDATHVIFTPSSPLLPGRRHVGLVNSARLRSADGDVMPGDYETDFTTTDTIPPVAQIGCAAQAQGITLTAGSTVTLSATAEDGTGVESARFQILQMNADSTVGAQVGSDFPASVIRLNACEGRQSVRLSARIVAPNDIVPTQYYVRVIVRDASANESTLDGVVSVVPTTMGFPFCGLTVSQAYVSSNGYITFDQGDSDYTPTVQKFFQHPRVSAFYTDDDLRIAGAQAFHRVIPGADPGFAVTWWNVGIYSGQTGPNTYQIVLFQSGAIQISYAGMADQQPSNAQFFMGVSCPCTPTTPAPPQTSLLSVQQSPDMTNEGRDILSWTGEPVYDFLDRSVQSAPTVRSVFETRYFNLVPPGVPTPAFVPTSTIGGTAIPILCDDCSALVPVTFE